MGMSFCTSCHFLLNTKSKSILVKINRKFVFKANFLRLVKIKDCVAGIGVNKSEQIFLIRCHVFSFDRSTTVGTSFTVYKVLIFDIG